MKTVKCPICKKEPAWVAWGNVTPCLKCVPAKLIIKSQG